MKKYDKKILLGGLVLVLVVLSIVGGLTYAFFTAEVVGNDIAREMVITTAKLSLRLKDTEKLELLGALPGASTTKTFTVENTGGNTTSYNIIISEVSTDFEGSDLVFSLTSTNGGGVVETRILPNTDETIVANVTIPKNVTQSYTLRVTFLETGENQNNNQGKSYTGKIQIVPVLGNIAIMGRATDGINPLRRETIMLESTPRTTETDDNGYYEFQNVEIGNHTVSIVREGVSVASKSVKIELGVDTKKTSDGILMLETVPRKFVNIELKEVNSEQVVDLVVKDPTLMISELSGNIYMGINKEITITGDHGPLTCISSDITKATCQIIENKLIITPVSDGAGTITLRESTFNSEITYNYNVKTITMDLGTSSGTVFAGGNNKVLTVTGQNMGTLYCGTTNSAHATCTVSGNVVTIEGVGAGNATITIREGNANISRTFEVNTKVAAKIKPFILAEETAKSDASVDFSYTSGGCTAYNCTPVAEKISNGLYYTANTTYGEEGQRIYYYRGDVDNNWVSFGGHYWRIMRTTSEGGVKLFYSGGNISEGPSSLGERSSEVVKAYYSGDGMDTNKYYLGYTRGTNSFIGTISSGMKLALEAWYTGGNTTNNECGDSNYEPINCDFRSITDPLITYQSYISPTALYCNDKSAEPTDSTRIIYPAETRLKITSPSRPTFACASGNGSRYTYQTISGNQKLTQPIGLITADETIYAGLVYKSWVSTQSYMMDNIQSGSFWTMTPSVLTISNTRPYALYVSSGFVSQMAPTLSTGIVPVVALKECVKIVGGNGTMESPYELSNSAC